MSSVTDPPSHQVKVPLFPVMTTDVVSGIKLFQKYILHKCWFWQRLMRIHCNFFAFSKNQIPDEKKSSKGKYTPKDAGGKFSNISPIVCDVYADSMSIPNPNNSGHQYPHPSPLARILRPIYSTLQSTTSPTAPPISCLFDPQHWHLRSLAQTIRNLDLKNLITGVREGVNKS